MRRDKTWLGRGVQGTLEDRFLQPELPREAPVSRCGVPDGYGPFLLSQGLSEVGGDAARPSFLSMCVRAHALFRPLLPGTGV